MLLQFYTILHLQGQISHLTWLFNSLEETPSVREHVCLWRGQCYKVTWRIKSAGLACVPGSPGSTDWSREGQGTSCQDHAAPHCQGHIRKNTKDRKSPHVSFLIITLEVQLIGLNRGTFCHVRCPRKPLLATVPPHSKGHRLLQSPVLYFPKAHKGLIFTRTQGKQFLDSQVLPLLSSRTLLFFLAYTHNFFLFPPCSLAFFNASLHNEGGCYKPNNQVAHCILSKKEVTFLISQIQ